MAREHPAAGTGSPPPWAWHSSRRFRSPGPLPEHLFDGTTAEVARRLLGCRLVSTVGGIEVQGVIIETEAYSGPHDPASHAAVRIGRTPRNSSMFLPAGHAYVYRSHGIHWCLNVVTEGAGFPAAVLIRALDPLEGLRSMEERREGRTPLCAGPGRLAQALGVSGALDGHPLHREPLTLRGGWPVSEREVEVSGRIGVRLASDWPMRFFLRGHPEVSRGQVHRGQLRPDAETESP